MPSSARRPSTCFRKRRPISSPRTTKKPCNPPTACSWTSSPWETQALGQRFITSQADRNSGSGRRNALHHQRRRRRHRAPARRREDRASRALRRADRPAEPGAVPRTARARAARRRAAASNSRCSISTSTNSRASTIRSDIMIGDELLKAVAASLAAASRETDLVARLGGDEFAIDSDRRSRTRADVDGTRDAAFIEAIRAALSMPRPSAHDRRQHRHRAGAAATAPISTSS